MSDTTNPLAGWTASYGSTVVTADLGAPTAPAPAPARYCVRNLAGHYLTGNLNLFTGSADLRYTPEAGIAYLYPTRAEAEYVAGRNGGLAAVYAPAQAPATPPPVISANLNLFA